MRYLTDAKNYYIKNGKAYTEDYICVHNIRVFKIPGTVDDDEVFEYFAKFGEVLKVHLITEKKGNGQKSTKMGAVHFADALVAAKVLQQPNHVLHSQLIEHKACDSWHQPSAYKFNKDDDVDEIAAEADTAAERHQSSPNSADADLGACGAAATASQPPALSILDLNDDCLGLIAKMLYMDDQVRMARTCTRFSGVVQTCLKANRQVALMYMGEMTLWEIRDYFRMSGPSIDTINDALVLGKERTRVFQLIAKNCPNVRRIWSQASQVIGSSLHKLTLHMKNITELRLDACWLRDKAILAIRKLPKLEKLSVSVNNDLTGKYMSLLTTLRHLDIHACGNIQSKFFVEAVQSLKELQSLDIKGCGLLLAFAFEEMLKHCGKLEVLRMSWSNMPYDCVARLPALKRLELFANGAPVRQSLFTSLCEHKSSQLEYLKITKHNCINPAAVELISQLSQLKHLSLSNNAGLNDASLREFCALDQLEHIILNNCSAISNVGLLNLMRRCLKLRIVSVQRCPKITDQFVYDVVELLRQRQQGLSSNHKQTPVIFFVRKTGISQFIMSSSKCQNTSSLIRLWFSYPYRVYTTDEAEQMQLYDYYDNENES